MKNIKCLWLVAAGFTSLAACDKKDLLKDNPYGSKVQVSSSVASFAPSATGFDTDSITFSWTAPKYSNDTVTTKFLIEIDSTGRNFTKGMSRSVTGKLSTKYSVKEFNSMLQAIGMPPGSANDIDVRVTSSYANNNEVYVSDIYKLKVTPYNPVNFAKGADISWVTQMESSGRKFYTAAGVETECFALMKSLGLTSIRLRVWVNPAAPGWCNTADLVAKAVRANNLGLRVLVDFHYSDSWADPGKQTKPAAWAGQTVAQLKASISAHTTAVLNAVKAAGVTPEWVQVGNETNNGMVWPDGQASTNMANYAQFELAGYDAVKAVFPTTKVIVHVSNGYDGGLFQWNIGGLLANGAKFDVIGMSLYPSATNYPSYNSGILANMNDMVARFGKEVMVVETGFASNNPALAKLFLTDLIAKVRVVNENKGIGVMYWEPEAYNGWQGYGLGAFDATGKPTAAMDAFK
ncbi:MAG: glycosyl hydrolase 53 family protein [Chitinophagaceae bacterium]